MDKGTITGPFEMSGYDTLDLVQAHDAFLPDGTVVKLPAGTKLVMLASSGSGPSVNVEQGKAASIARKPEPAATA